MRGFYSGLIGGMVAGLWVIIWAIMVRYEAVFNALTSLELWINYLIFQIGVAGILGGVFGVVYSRFYRGIRGEDVKKSLLFGLIIAMLANVVISTDRLLHFLLLEGEHGQLLSEGVGWLLTSLKWILYGFVLGIVYERLKL